uniref:Uncharacterized protein AlNc14C108G6287 n=1 Tax=Albugo laibachii Nc14 TaxID=890382 RepID=F0WI80_9STRA|nr:conserved hypothetical protein [Albugo laibachii Nc14]|eukprot:CCA20959.1 conserved hypothetical protein [Albugo laibachii Nc14]
MGTDRDDELYPLETAWSIWELREQQKNLSYADTLFKMCTFKSVGKFWGYWNNILKPSQVLFDGFTRKRIGDRYVESFAVFREGIVPEWEDPQNRTGGEWSIRKELTGPVLDKLWEITVLGAIGEQLDEGDEITGVRVIHKNKKDKKDMVNFYRFEIWLRSQDRTKANQVLNRFLKLVNGTLDGDQWTTHDCQYKNH